jgi:hypothetical protein
LYFFVKKEISCSLSTYLPKGEISSCLHVQFLFLSKSNRNRKVSTTNIQSHKYNISLTSVRCESHCFVRTDGLTWRGYSDSSVCDCVQNGS